MSLIQYQQATYAIQLRSQLELAGCEPAVAGIVARAIGELIDHLSQLERDIQRKSSINEYDLSLHRRDPLECLIGMGVGIGMLATSIIVGVLISLFH